MCGCVFWIDPYNYYNYSKLYFTFTFWGYIMQTLSINHDLKRTVHNKTLRLTCVGEDNGKVHTRTFDSVHVSTVGSFINLTDEAVLLKTEIDVLSIPSHGSCAGSLKNIVIRSGSESSVTLPPERKKVWWILPREVAQERGLLWFMNRHDVCCPNKGVLYTNTTLKDTTNGHSEWDFEILRN